MDIYRFVGGIIGGLASSSAVLWFVVKTTKEYWIERSKAEYAEKLEHLKAKLDQGNYVTQAQYDLELSSYKEFWHAMSGLNESLKEALLWPSRVVQMQMEGEELKRKTKQLDAKLSKAFDNAILVTERLAPFYEKNIHEEARATMLLIQQLADGVRSGTTTSEELQSKANSIFDGSEKILVLIRDRLASLRLL